MEDFDLRRWTPFALREEADGVMVDWCDLGERRFVEPFFDQTIRKCQWEPDYRERFRVTDADALHRVSESPGGLQPAGFIYHSSRCGSTLVTQILASMKQCRVLSEPAILGTLIQKARSNGFDDGSVRLLRGVIAALGVAREAEKHTFIKFDSRAILALPMIRRAFPDVPWMFLYREPLEILGAQVWSPNGRLPPGVASAGLLDGDPTEIEKMPPEEFWTRVLASRFEAALEFYVPGEALMVNYRQLPGAVWGSVLPFFGVACRGEDIDLMRAASRLDAKNPAKNFEDDRGRKRRGASTALQELVNLLVMESYVRLNDLAEIKLRAG